jgi:hypothetical protein
MLISLIIHAVLLIFAVSFVAVKVIQKKESAFNDVHVARPKMPPKRLQVPVKVKKRTPPPRLRKQIVAKKVVQKMPEIKMPELKGIKSNVNMTGTGLGGASSVGFTMPEINVFGIKSRGEKVLFILDCSSAMMDDRIGGMAAYRIIKEELVSILRTLPPTTLINVVVCEIPYGSSGLFNTLVPATKGNIQKVEDWIAPLNEVPDSEKFLAQKDPGKFFGRATLAKGGKPLSNIAPGLGGKSPAAEGGFFRPLFHAMQWQTDTVFLLTASWGYHVHIIKEGTKDPKKEKLWRKNLEIAKERIKEENKARVEKGLTPLAISGTDLFSHYKDLYVDTSAVRREAESWTPKDLVSSLKETWDESRKKYPKTLGLKGKKKYPFSINVVQFVPQGDANLDVVDRFKALVSKSHGRYRSISGLKAIEASAITRSISSSKEKKTESEK